MGKLDRRHTVCVFAVADDNRNRITKLLLPYRKGRRLLFLDGAAGGFFLPR